MIDLSIIIVSWNVKELLRQCLASVESGRGALNLQVIIVDNASTDKSGEMVAAETIWGSPRQKGVTCSS